MLFYDVTSSLFRGLQDDDGTQAFTSDFVLRPLHPVTRTNGAFNPHHCDEDDMEGRFKKIVVSPFADAIEERLPQQQPIERRPSLTQAQPVGSNANGGAGKWEGKQSGRNGKELAISILFTVRRPKASRSTGHSTYWSRDRFRRGAGRQVVLRRDRFHQYHSATKLLGTGTGSHSH